jgi:type I restriction enzyme R subunit
MTKVGEIERNTQNRVVMLLANDLKYDYLGDFKDREANSNIELDLLRTYLKKQGYSDILINRAIDELVKVAGDQSKSLYDVNKEVYHLLRYGAHQKEDVGKTKETVLFIDWETPQNNHFAFAEEVSVLGEHSKRPDIVLYINGIAIGVLELKRSTVSVSEGIRQNIDNQKSTFIRPFFTTMQLVMAGNDTEGLRYGSIETPEKYYLTWKEDLPIDNLLDRHLTCMCQKERLIELLHDFVVFDRGIKKLCRVNQYFGIKSTQDFLRKREGGIIWHTQGSGKSLFMVWLTKWIRENITGSRVLIITDRDELDKQIEKVFKGVSEEIVRTKSGADLIEKLNAASPWLLCSLIHKFGNKEEPDYDEFIEDLKRSLPADFKAKGDIYVLVDECHRTQSGKLHKAMKMILPNAVFVGFTGTPLLKKDKETSIEVFGRYIHTYKFDEAVSDGVVLDLLYEARDIDQYITSQTKIDQWFDSKTKGLNEYQKTELKKRWGTMQKMLSSKSRLEQIVKDIVFDMSTKPRLMSGRGNAMLVSGSIYQACKFYELFQHTDLAGKCAIVTSYNPSVNDIKGEASSDNAITERLKQYEIYMEMLKGKSAEVFEDEAKKKFVDEPAQLKLLIVVDKLLTGLMPQVLPSCI